MKKYLVSAGLFLSVVALAASSFTTHYQLEKPQDGDVNWGNSYRSNMNEIDEQMFINMSSVTAHIASVTAHAAANITALAGTECPSATNVQEFLDCLDAAATNTVHLTGDETITGNKTFTGNNNFTGSNQFTSLNTLSGQLQLAGTGRVTFAANALHETKNRAVVTDSLGSVTTMNDISDENVQQLAGVTGNIQDQINNIINGGSGAPYVLRTGDSMSGALNIQGATMQETGSGVNKAFTITAPASVTGGVRVVTEGATAYFGTPGRTVIGSIPQGAVLVTQDDGGIDVPYVEASVTTADELAFLSGVGGLANGYPLTKDGVGNIGIIPVTSAEIYSLVGVTANVQSQLNALAAATVDGSAFVAKVGSTMTGTLGISKASASDQLRLQRTGSAPGVSFIGAADNQIIFQDSTNSPFMNFMAGVTPNVEFGNDGTVKLIRTGANSLRVHAYTTFNNPISYDQAFNLSGVSTYALANDNEFYGLTGTTASTIGGIVASPRGTEMFIYSPAAPLTIGNEEPSAIAADRINTLTGTNLVCSTPPCWVRLMYDGVTSRWIVTDSVNPSTSGLYVAKAGDTMTGTLFGTNVYMASGSAAAPSFSTPNSHGIYESSSSTLAFAVQGIPGAFLNNSGQLVFVPPSNSYSLLSTTADGSDNAAAFMSGSGAIDINRGAYLELQGNEYGGGGNAIINTGTAVGAQFVVNQNGTPRLSVQENQIILNNDVSITNHDLIITSAGDGSPEQSINIGGNVLGVTASGTDAIRIQQQITGTFNYVSGIAFLSQLNGVTANTVIGDEASLGISSASRIGLLKAQQMGPNISPDSYIDVAEFRTTTPNLGGFIGQLTLEKIGPSTSGLQEITGSVVGKAIYLNGITSSTSVTGLSVDVGSAVVTAPFGRPIGIGVGGPMQVNANAVPFSSHPSAVDSINVVNTSVYVPTTLTGSGVIGLVSPLNLTADATVDADPLGVGVASVGYVSLLGITSGVTVNTMGGAVSAIVNTFGSTGNTGGHLGTMYGYMFKGLIAGGGSNTVGAANAFWVADGACSGITLCRGLFIEDAVARSVLLGPVQLGLTPNTVPYLDGTTTLVSSAITPTELGYLSGATANIQGQINNITVGGSFVAKAGDTMTGTLGITQASDSTQIHLIRTGSAPGNGYFGVAGDAFQMRDSTVAQKFNFDWTANPTMYWGSGSDAGIERYASGALRTNASLAFSGSSSGQTQFTAAATASGTYIYPASAPTSAGDSFLTAVSGATSQMTWKEWRAPSVTTYTTAGSNLYTVPSGARYITINMVGAGGGGGPSSNVALGSVGGSSVIIGVATATGGGAGPWGLTGATGGVSTVATSGTILDCGSTNGGYGNPGEELLLTDYGVGGNGGSSYYGGAGGGGGPVSNGQTAATASGSGGGGAGVGGPGKSGAGGGAGGYVCATVTNLSATYPVTVGAAGGGASGAGNGGSGKVVITEYYQ